MAIDVAAPLVYSQFCVEVFHFMILPPSAGYVSVQLTIQRDLLSPLPPAAISVAQPGIVTQGLGITAVRSYDRFSPFAIALAFALFMAAALAAIPLS